MRLVLLSFCTFTLLGCGAAVGGSGNPAGASGGKCSNLTQLEMCSGNNRLTCSVKNIWVVAEICSAGQVCKSHVPGVGQPASALLTECAATGAVGDAGSGDVAVAKDGGAAAAEVTDSGLADAAVSVDLGAKTEIIAQDIGEKPDVQTKIDTGENPNDVSGPDTGENAKCPGAPGCTCKENGDCDNAQCIEIGSGKVCATPCVDKCQDGYKCSLINSSGGDSVTICVPKFIHLCDPCVKSKDCQSLGNGDAACVNEASRGNFCGTACTADGDCSAGYGCQSVKSVEGADVKQCVKTSSAPELKYGECTCSELAVAQKAQTSCFIEYKNDKGELVGKCAGVRACGASGLTTCAAPALDVEVCDGKDNDCDGVTDEETCTAGADCNIGKCNPIAGCEYTKLSDIACNADSNTCTVNDQCKQGVCVAGFIKKCDDLNACTSDTCHSASGFCVYKAMAEGAPCADGKQCQGGICK